MLNKAKGNMYSWVTHTWNTIKGECPHGCTYCYVKRWGKQKPVRLDAKELQTDLGSNNFIFVGSSCDMFADSIPEEWILLTLGYCNAFPHNNYLFQSKNPARMSFYLLRHFFPKNSIFCTTIETNRYDQQYMGITPTPMYRAEYMHRIAQIANTYVTIEPIMDFDTDEMLDIIELCQPDQVNIGADSGNNHLPEPSKEKLLTLIDELKTFTVIDKKNNLKRLLT
jgi:protein gp37